MKTTSQTRPRHGVGPTKVERSVVERPVVTAKKKENTVPKLDQLVEGTGQETDKPQLNVAAGTRQAPWMTRLSAEIPPSTTEAVNTNNVPTRIGNAPAPESVEGDTKAAWAALAQIPGLDLGGASVSPLKGGATNSLFQVKLPSEDATYVLRLAGAGNQHIDRAADADGYRRAADQGIGPQVRFIDDRNETILVEFVDAHPISNEALTDERFTQVADVLRTIHGAPPTGNAKTFDPFARIDEAADALRAKGPLTPAVEKALSFVAELDSGLRPFIEGSLIPCHNDTNPGNLLLAEGKVWAIDWDYAGNGDPFYDLGTLAATLSLDGKQSRTLMAKYRGVDESEVSSPDLAHLEMSRLTNTLWASLWFFAKSEQSGDLNSQIGQANLEDFSKRIENFKDFRPDAASTSNVSD